MGSSEFVLGGPLVLAGWLGLDLLVTGPISLLRLVFVLGASSFATGALTMAGSYATAAFNIGAALGPVLLA
ncbi:hypothetical protein [Lentzea sp. NBRC 102530]|uniref:hypothetical protein n=1 Tax=Lentzea sp. NBRC 102530 TaxID=3032201 RepID=UPI0024A1FBF3|nr:hypothetical protein [Lentzea sp. NBRC 102530]GLY48407.1 hypothetical protein Lesp01_20630 [Lentzea sp. NBRC 102530]